MRGSHLVWLTEKERNRLAKFAAKLGSAINELVSIVHPDTLRRWIRALNQTVKKKVAKRGRPKTDAEIRELLLKLAREFDAREQDGEVGRVHFDVLSAGLASWSLEAAALQAAMLIAAIRPT